MSRTVFCRKYQADLPGLKNPPFPNPKGQKIFETISQRAWDEWQAIQTRLINEKQLNMLDLEARQFIESEQEKFFDNQDYEDAEGYVPPSASTNTKAASDLAIDVTHTNKKPE